MEKRKIRPGSLSTNSHFFNMAKKLASLVLVFSFVLAPFEPVLAAPAPTAPTEPAVAPAPAPTETTTPEAPATTEATTDTTVATPATEQVIAPTPETSTEEVQTLEATVEEPEPVEVKRTERSNRLGIVDESTGVFTFNFPFALPPGRNNMTPEISLKYNSSNINEDSPFGVGWSLNIPYIQRIKKPGTFDMYTESTFYSSLSEELVATNPEKTAYGAKNENGSFLSYKLENNTFIATDKEGNTYTFGSNTSSRQDDPNDQTRIYKWMIEEIKDTNGNSIKFSYTKDSGVIYPDTITYTNNGTSFGIFKVTFEKNSRINPPISYITSFKTAYNFYISKIKVDINNTERKKYDFVYNNSAQNNQLLLKSITDSGISDTGQITTLPVTEFDYTNDPTSWAYTPSYDLNGASFNEINGYRFTDLNGDGVTDIVRSVDTTGTTFYTNMGNRFLNSPGNMPTGVAFNSSSGNFSDATLGDLNYDLIPDLFNSGNNLTNAFININTIWSHDPSYNFPTTEFKREQGANFIDINGDGLNDIVIGQQVGNREYETRHYILINKGDKTFEDKTTSWGLPRKVDGSGFLETFTGPNGTDSGLQFADINGDSLPDLFRNNYVYLNNGRNGWVNTNEFTYPTNYNDRASKIIDSNGDGFADFLYATRRYDKYSGGNIWLSTGANFSSIDLTDFPQIQGVDEKHEAFADENNRNTPLRIVDINGDNLPDMINGSSVYLNTSQTPPNYLKQIKHNTGATTDITYKPTTKLRDGSGNLLNPKLPVPQYVVTEIKHTDSQSPTETYSYSYIDGKFYTADTKNRKFAGFGQVVKTDPAGNVTKTYFHQGDTTNTALGEFDDHISKAGKIYRVEEYDNAGNLFILSVNKWDKQNLGTDRNFVQLVRETTLQYDGDTDHADTAKEYVYDNLNGNIKQKIDNGLVTASTDGSFTDIGTDKSIEAIDYASNTTNGVIGLPYQNTLFDSFLSRIRSTRIYYDNNQTLGVVGAGNPTKIENWVTGSTYVTSQKSYNPNGTVATETDPRGKVTSYIYDTYNLYPSTVTKPLSYITSYTYDYSSGKPKQITDANNFIYQNTYDGLGRITEEKIPDETSPYAPVTKTKYIYTDTPNAVSVKKTDHLSGTNAVETYQYFDGFGRLVQERRTIEGTSGGNFAVKDVVYNNLGLVQKESLPYGGINSGKTNPSTNSLLYTNYTYDALQRPLTVSNSIGTTNYSYDDLRTQVTDAKGKIKYFSKDARGNLARVEEINSGTTYTTNYVWNLNGNLTKITDALGNVRNFVYDGLGRRTRAEDLHAPSDTTFGVWQFSYDNAGNLTQTISPNAHIVNYTYTDLNQIQTEDFTGGTGTEVTYYQNSGCSNGKGRLCGIIINGLGSFSYTYGPNNNPLSETKYISPSSYTTSFTYDRQGNTTKIVYPDNSEVVYTYNVAGLLEKIERKESGGALTTVVSNFDYTPMRQTQTKAFANFVNTTYSYDANKMYRLSRIFTRNNVPANLQDLNYTYDPVGNITKVIDSSMTSTAKTVDYIYDDLHRLKSANATGAINGQNYYQAFNYNEIGNLTSAPIGSYIYTGTSYANPHAPTSVAGATYTYDNNGNLLTNGTLSNTWNYKNQITSIVKGGVTSSYKYDHAGQRVVETVGTTTTTYANKYYNITNSGKKTKQIYAGDELVATLETVGTTTTPYYVHTDHLGSTNVITGSSGTKVETLDYFPFGDVRLNEKVGSFDSKRKYIGQEVDDVTGLNYLNARYYNSKTGGFLSQDSVFLSVGNKGEIESKTGLKFGDYLSDPQAMNSYSYARNNPIRYEDRSGNYVESVFDATMLALSIQAYKEKPSFWNGVSVVLDTLSVVAPGVPAVAGAIIRVNKIENATEVLKNVIKISDDSNLRFSQNTVSNTFDELGIFKGATRSSVVEGLKLGNINPKDIPINYIEKDGYKIIENNRSASVLIEAGVPQSKWNLKNQTGNKDVENRVNKHLQNNRLSPKGTTKVRVN